MSMKITTSGESFGKMQNVMFPGSGLFFVCLLVVVLIVMVQSSAVAQTGGDIGSIKGIVLKDGTVVRGQVLQMSTEKVIVRTPDGNISIHKFDDVETFIKDESQFGRSEKVYSSYSQYQRTDYKRQYFVFKAGVYSPQSDDLEEFDEGFNGEVAFGYYFNRNLAVELGVGYFYTEASESGYVDFFGIRSASVEADIDVVPLTAALKIIAPLGQVELYALGGVGMYFASGELKVSIAGIGSDTAEDDDVSFGGFLGAGVNFNITNQVFLGIESKYHWVEANWEYEGIEVDAELDGWTITGNLGIRF